MMFDSKATHNHTWTHIHRQSQRKTEQHVRPYTGNVHTFLQAGSQIKVLAKSLFSVMPCGANGAWDGSHMRDHHLAVTPGKTDAS